jgi:HD-like signal output (HDOD) protein/GGDEF domain-containing protein
MPDPAVVLDRLASRAGHLYSLPAVAMEVLDLTSNPEVDTRALKDCIENDPALTAKILRVVNSSLFGLSREVSDLNQALALLGSKPLKMLVLGFSLPAGLFDAVEAHVLHDYWRRTLTKAVAARELSEVVWNMPGDDAFIAGLLQDIGQLLLIQQIGEPYLNLLQRVRTDGRVLATTEVETMGFDHTELSARMLATWGLPQGMVEAVAWSHRLHESLGDHPAAPLKQIVHLAELLSQLLIDGHAGSLAEVLAAGERYRQMSEQQLGDVVGAVEEKVRSLADVLSLDLPEGLDYRDVLLRAHRRLADLSEAVVEEMLRDRAQPLDARSDSDGDTEPAAAHAPSGLRTRPHDVQRLVDALAEVERSCEPILSSTRPSDDSPGGEPPASKPAAAETAVQPAATATLSEMRPGPGLLHQIRVAGRACRQSRRPLSLLLVELDGTDAVLFESGPDGYARVFRELEDVCRAIDHRPSIYVPAGTAGAAVVLPSCDRPDAVRYGNSIAAQLRDRFESRGGSDAHRDIHVGVGAATVTAVPKNFAAEDLHAAAARCLYASHASGGVIKSIEIY